MRAHLQAPFCTLPLMQVIFGSETIGFSGFGSSTHRQAFLPVLTNFIVASHSQAPFLTTPFTQLIVGREGSTTAVPGFSGFGPFGFTGSTTTVPGVSGCCGGREFGGKVFRAANIGAPNALVEVGLQLCTLFSGATVFSAHVTLVVFSTPRSTVAAATKPPWGCGTGCATPEKEPCVQSSE